MHTIVYMVAHVYPMYNGVSDDTDISSSLTWNNNDRAVCHMKVIQIERKLCRKRLKISKLFKFSKYFFVTSKITSKKYFMPDPEGG